jgi:hypothetical protein
MTDNPQQSDLFGSRRKPQRRWIEAAERRAAQKAAFDALPEAERAAIWARIDRLLFIEAKWIRAKSLEYVSNPHSYTRRRDFRHDDDFRWLITMIREGGIGTREKYDDRWYDVLNYRGAKFWPMGWPLDYSNGTWCTVILNKKPVWPTDR